MWVEKREGGNRAERERPREVVERDIGRECEVDRMCVCLFV